MNDTELVERLDRLMRTIDAEMHRHAPAVDDENIGPLGSIALKHLATLAPTPTHNLVSALGRDPSQVSRVIKRLETKGLLSRSEGHSDKRLSIVDITAKGREHVEKLDVILAQVVRQMLKPLTRDEVDALKRTVGKMVT